MAAGKAVRAGLAVEGAYLNRYVTDEQRSRRAIFNATLLGGNEGLGATEDQYLNHLDQVAVIAFGS